MNGDDLIRELTSIDRHLHAIRWLIIALIVTQLVSAVLVAVLA